MRKNVKYQTRGQGLPHPIEHTHTTYPYHTHNTHTCHTYTPHIYTHHTHIQAQHIHTPHTYPTNTSHTYPTHTTHIIPYTIPACTPTTHTYKPRKGEDGPKQKGSNDQWPSTSGLIHFPFLVLKVIKNGSSLFIVCFQKYPYILWINNCLFDCYSMVI